MLYALQVASIYVEISLQKCKIWLMLFYLLYKTHTTRYVRKYYMKLSKRCITALKFNTCFE